MFNLLDTLRTIDIAVRFVSFGAVMVGVAILPSLIHRLWRKRAAK